MTITEFESCEVADGVWVSSNRDELHMWVRRVGENPKLQHIVIRLYSVTDLEILQMAVTSLDAPDNRISTATVASTTLCRTTSYDTDHCSNGRWVSAEDGNLAMKVKRSTVHGKRSELRIAICTPEALHDLVEAMSTFSIVR